MKIFFREGKNRSGVSHCTANGRRLDIGIMYNKERHIGYTKDTETPHPLK